MKIQAEYVQFDCPDCDHSTYGLGGLGENLRTITEMIQGKPTCETCGGSKKVLVMRPNIIRVSR